MEKHNLNKDIIRLAAPAIINNITVPLLGLCDTAIAGHLGSPSYLGGIAIGSMMLNVFYWLSGFLRMGTTGLTARSFGRDSLEECRVVIQKSLLLALMISSLVLLFQRPLLKLLLHLISPESESAELAATYFRIGVWGVPAQLFIMAVSGWFIGLQTTLVPMTIAIGTNIINILCSLMFAFGMKKGFVGIAGGTLCANWVGAIGALLWGYNRYRRLAKGYEMYKGEDRGAQTIRWGELFSVNGALFVRSACIMGVTLAVTAVGAHLGEMTLAANAIIMQFFIFFSYFMDGFAFSGEALAGKYSGGGNMDMVKKTMFALCRWGVVMAVLFFLIYFGFSERIASLLTDSEEVSAEIAHYRVWIFLMPPVTVAAFLFDGVFVGLTKTRDMMWVTIAGASAFFLIILIGWRGLGNNLLWLSFETYLLIRGGALAVIFINKFTKESRN